MNQSINALTRLNEALQRHAQFWKTAKNPAQFVIHTTLEEIRASINEAIFYVTQDQQAAAAPAPSPVPALPVPAGGSPGSPVPVAPITPGVAPVPGPTVTLSSPLPGPSVLPPATPGGIIQGEIHVDGGGQMHT